MNSPFIYATRLLSTARPVRRLKPRAPDMKKTHFVDFKRIQVTGGKGGDGMMSFLSLPLTEYAGPDGGNGGNGGHVIFEADTSMKSLSHLKSTVQGQEGIDGHTKHRHGKNAEHTIVKLPLGTEVTTEDGHIVGQLDKPGDYCVAAHGGSGGKGNHFFLTNENRGPTEHEIGAIGQKRTLYIEMKVIAHAGLVGFPNVGKSSLLRAISRARPKVAAYPFTTLNPHVGIVEYDDFLQIAVADIPGLIAGAHLNYGLGFSFLRHIQRCLCLLYVIDLSQDSFLYQLRDLRFELEKYEAGLSKRPHAIIGNKLDITGSEENMETLRAETGLPVIGLSAKYGINITNLLIHLRELYDEHSPQTSDTNTFDDHRNS